MKYARWSWLAVLGLLAGCVIPKIINHPQPELKVDFTPFENAGCPLDDYGYYRLCDHDSELYTLGCDRIEAAPDLMGGLDPAYPIAVCIYIPLWRPEITNPHNTPASEYFFNVGGPMPMLVRYVMVVDGNFQIIKNADEFRSAFAPVESTDEALSFILAMQDVFASYDQTVNLKYRYEVDTLEDTYSETTEGGYIVHAFNYDFFGCGPHYTFAVDLKVASEGFIEELDRKQIFRDPALDDLCQD